MVLRPFNVRTSDANGPLWTDGKRPGTGRQLKFEQMGLELGQIRPTSSTQLKPDQKAELGQFMTPAPVARFMASLFSPIRGPARLLDAGAGAGSLTAAFIDRWGAERTRVTAYEIDETIAPELRNTLAHYRHSGLEATALERDFIGDAVDSIRSGNRGRAFTHAILNPPYKKINSGSAHRASLRVVGLETVNLYTAFVGLALELMGQGGEVVAIIPRSFCNGPYYRPFREWMLARAALERIHLFHSRTSAFSDDNVLQENVIIKLVRGKPQGHVAVTTSSDSEFTDIKSCEYPFAEIVYNGDAQQFIHVPTAPTHGGLDDVPLAERSLDELGLAVSTGPVVDFRLKQFLRQRPGPDTVPLLYPSHFAGGALKWPRQSKKPNAVLDCLATRKWLYPSGFYTVVRRFSSKEERRRIVAHVVSPSVFETTAIGFENHLNVFHCGRRGLERDTAYGLSTFLNSRAVDEYFRRFSGHTQVNATDLRALRYPEPPRLKHLGQWAQASGHLTQERIDEQIEMLNGRRKIHR